MRYFQKTLAAAMLLMAVFALSACGASDQAGDDANNANGEAMSAAEAQSTVSDAIDKLADVKSYSFDGSVDVTVTESTAVTTFNLALKGDQDISSLESKQKFNVELSGSVESPSMGVNEMSLDAELRANGENFYFIVNSVTGLDDLGLTPFVEPYLGKWWFSPMPENAVSADASMELENPDGSELQMDANMEAQVKALVKESSFFTNVKSLNDESGSYHFSGDLDEAGLREFLVKLSALNDQPMSEQDLAEFDQAMENMTLSAEIWVDKDSGILSGISVVASFKEPTTGETASANPVNADVKFKVMLADFNKPITVDVPADASSIDELGAALGAFGGMGAGMGADSSDLESEFAL